MASLTTGEANRLLDASLGTAAFTAPTGPIQVALMTVNGDDGSAGTEVTGGSYARQDVTFGSAASGATSNAALLRWDDMPACTVVGVELYDSAGSPRRMWWGALSASKTVGAGDSFEIAAGDLDVTLT